MDELVEEQIRRDLAAKAAGKKLSFPDGSCTCAHRGQGLPYECQVKGSDRPAR